MTQRIRMLRDDKAAPHGHTVVVFKAGTEHDAPDWMVDAFVANGSCELVTDEPPAQTATETPHVAPSAGPTATTEAKPPRRRRKGE